MCSSAAEINHIIQRRCDMTCMASPKLGKGRHNNAVCPMIGHTRSSGITLGSVSLLCSRTRCRSASLSCGGVWWADLSVLLLWLWDHGSLAFFLPQLLLLSLQKSSTGLRPPLSPYKLEVLSQQIEVFLWL